MDKKSLLTIHRIMAILMELHILTESKDAEYFYDRMEIQILLELIDELEEKLFEVNAQVKNKYPEVDWKFVQKARYYNEVFGKSMRLRDAWEIASQAYDSLYNSMLDILSKELEEYYHEECARRKKNLEKANYRLNQEVRKL